jgi:hypothetical protein
MRRYALTKPINPRLTAVGRLSSVRDGEVQGSRELDGRLGMRKRVRAGLRDDDHVDRWRDIGPAMPEHVAQKPFDSIPDHCVADSSAHSDTETRARTLCRPPDHYELRSVTPTTSSLKTQELGAATEPHRLRITSGPLHGINPVASAEC